MSALFSRRSGSATYAPSPPSSCAARREQLVARLRLADEPAHQHVLERALAARELDRPAETVLVATRSAPIQSASDVRSRTCVRRVEHVLAVHFGQCVRERARQAVRPQPDPRPQRQAQEAGDHRRAPRARSGRARRRRAPPIRPPSATSSGRSFRSRAPRISGTRYGAEAPRSCSCSSGVSAGERIVASLHRDERLRDGGMELRPDVALDLRRAPRPRERPARYGRSLVIASKLSATIRKCAASGRSSAGIP